MRVPTMVAIFAVTLVACQGQYLPPAAATMDLVLDEFRFEHETDLRAGRVVFRARNEGDLYHELVIVSLPEDFLPIGEQLQSDTRRPLDPFFLHPRLRPGGSTTFAVDFEPGRYAFLCTLVSPDDPEGRTHALRGMSSEIRVG